MKITLPADFGGDNMMMMEDEELLDKNSPSGSVLSADAHPYHPSETYYGPIEIAIYNDGIPCMTLVNEADRCQLLHGISDEAIDESFPLDATDAAEIEACEAFVCEMANLALLEEREEQARMTFNHIKKRWEARRQKGPSSRGPRAPMNLIIPTEHRVKTSFPSSSSNNTNTNNMSASLMMYSHSTKMMEDKMRHKEVTTMKARQMEQPRRNKAANMMNKPQRPIQQPRKDS